MTSFSRLSRLSYASTPPTMGKKLAITSEVVSGGSANGSRIEDLVAEPVKVIKDLSARRG